MREILTGKEIKRADQRTILEMEVPSAVLMERAALAVAEEVRSGSYRTDRILAVCGTGNNGGDGVAAARILHTLGYHADVYYVGEEEKFSEELRRQKKIAENYGVPVVKNPVYAEYTVIVDAIFGIGLTRPLAGKWADTVKEINKSGVPVVAVDIPSGVHTDTGAILGCAVNAVTTVTFTCQKPGLLFYPGREHAGRVLLRDVGIWVDPEREDAPFLEVQLKRRI